MEEDFEVGPYVGEGVCAGVANDGFDQNEHPGRYAGNTSHVGFASALDDGADLRLPLVHEDDAARGYADQIDEWIEVLEQYGGEVAAVSASVEGRGAVAAAEDESFLVEESRAGVVAQVEGDGVESAGVVCPAENVGGDGNVFAACVGRAAALCEPSRGAGPKHIALAVDHASDIGLQGFVSVDGDRAAESVVRIGGSREAVEVVRVSPFGVASGTE